MKFEMRNTGERKRHSSPVVDYSLEGPNEPAKSIADELFQERYVLSSNAYVSFYSNAAQLPFKRAQAENNLRAFMYREALPMVDELLLIADSEEVRELAVRIKSAMAQGKVA